ncbi:unnamed protein product [Calypogeia fissa]
MLKYFTLCMQAGYPVQAKSLINIIKKKLKKKSNALRQLRVGPLQDEFFHLHHLPSGAARASPCVCGHPLDPVGIHILHCSHGSKQTATHDDLRNVLTAIALDAGYHVSAEQTHVLPTVDGIPDWRRADIVFSQAGVQTLVDVVVPDPMGASIVSLAAHIFGHVAAHAVGLKEEVYAICHVEDLFYPFAVEVFGVLHLALDGFLWSSAVLCVERQPYHSISVVTVFLRQRVLVAL